LAENPVFISVWLFGTRIAIYIAVTMQSGAKMEVVNLETTSLPALLE
jgi:hypothetical protein